MRNKREKIYTVGNNKYGIPELTGIDVIPENLYPYRKTKERNGFAHFFMYDYYFEGLWTFPERYTESIKRYQGVLTPDWSLFRDWPIAMQIYNTYRNRQIGYYWQKAGLQVIPTVGWSDEKSYEFCFDGLPYFSTVAISSNGVIRNKESEKYFLKGYEEMIKRITPKNILLVGRNPWGLDVIEYPSFDMTKGWSATPS